MLENFNAKLISVLLTLFISFHLIILTTFPSDPSLDDPQVKNKLEPWLWEKLKKLEANGTNRFYTIIVGVDCSDIYHFGPNLAYEYKVEIAEKLKKYHGAEILSIGSLLSYINCKVRVYEIKRIALYDFVDGIGDGERIIVPLLS